MKPIIRGLAAAALCVAIGLPLTATTNIWSVSSVGTCPTAYKSLDAGVTWIPKTGVAPYDLPCTESYLTVMQGGSDALGRPVILVGSTQHLWRSVDDGNSWREVSGPGSGLESTSKRFSALLTALTAYGTRDFLVGVTSTGTGTSATDGGVYLSGDGGVQWTQINSGFDPNTLNISTLVKTSCSGCPVQYYSGTYGSGVYTRTITVSPPPSITSWCFGEGCTCGTQAASGYSGQAFKLCGNNFNSTFPSVTFGWEGLATTGYLGYAGEGKNVSMSGCTVSSTLINCQAGASSTCGGTSSHPGVPSWSGTVFISMHNIDTRVGVMPAQFTYNNILY